MRCVVGVGKGQEWNVAVGGRRCAPRFRNNEMRKRGGAAVAALRVGSSMNCYAYGNGMRRSGGRSLCVRQDDGISRYAVAAARRRSYACRGRAVAETRCPSAAVTAQNSEYT